MSSFDWGKVWDRRYNNSSDERWKIKSLNPMSPEQIIVKLPTTGKGGSPGSTQSGGGGQDPTKGDLLPSPKINKINECMYCITLDQQINLFYYVPPEDRVKKKSNKTFGKSEYQLEQKIETVTGFTNESGDNYILVGTVDKVILLKIVRENYDYVIKPTESIIQIPGFRTLVCFGNSRIVAVSASQLY